MIPLPSVAGLHRGVAARLERLLRRGALLRVLAGSALFLLLAWVLVGEGWRVGSPLPLVLDATAITLVVLALGAFRRRRARIVSERAVSGVMERAAGVPDGLVQGALELRRSIPEGVSPSLATHSEQALVARLPGDIRGLAGTVGTELERAARRALLLAVIAVPLLLAAAVVSPTRTKTAWAGLVSPIGTLTGPELPALEVWPGSVEVRRGAPVEVRVEAGLRERVTLHWQAAGDVARSAVLAVEGDSALHRFADVAAEIRYRVEAPDGARSEEFVLTPVDPLFVSDVTLRLDFPAYTGRPPEEFRGEIPPLTLPVGTGIGFRGRASRDLSVAELRAGDAVALDLPVTGPRFEADWRPRRGGEYGWHFLDAEGEAAMVVPPPVVLTLVPDSAPSIRIALPAQDTLLPTNLRQPLVLEAHDDYGLRSLELVAWRVTALGEGLDPVAQTLDLGGTRSALARPVLDVSRWGLLPGDQVRYFARVRDLHPSGQTSVTVEHVLRMPTADELRRRAQDRIEDAAERLRQLQDEADRAAEDARTLERTAEAPDRAEGAREGDPSFQEQEDVRRALEDQQELVEQADSLGNELDALSEALKEAGASDPELQEDLEELQRLLEEMGGDELQERLQEMIDQLDEAGDSEVGETLEELTQSQEEFRQQLEEALERAQRAAVEQDFRNTTSEAEELAEEQRALAESLMEEGEAGLRQEQQKELSDRAEALQERMDELGDRLTELEEDRAAERLDEARETARQAQEAMDRSAREAGSRSQQAQESAQEAAEEMDEAAQQLREAQQQMMAERAEAFQDALEQTAQDALSLASEQSRTSEGLEGATRDQVAEMRADVAAVEQGVRSLAQNVDMAARLAGTDNREMSAQMGEAMEALSRAREAMEGQSGARSSPQAASEDAVAALNRVAASALATIRAMRQGGQSAQPTPEEMMEQLEQMAQQQADVNNQASQMMPMQLTPQAMQEMMEQLAQEQQEVASELGQMSEQEGEEGPLGDLEALAQEAQALAEMLQGGRLDAQTRERQERLFHRLLDAGRSLEREEESTERESEVAGSFEREAVGALSAGDLGLVRFQLPDAAALNRLPPAARALVLRYFERLNSGGGGGR